MPLSKFIDDADEVLKLQPQELAGYVIQDLKEELASAGNTFIQMPNYVLSIKSHYPKSTKRVALEEAVNEAVAWLISEALLMRDFTDTSSSFYKLTKRAQQLSTPEDINKLARIRETLPKAFLHPLIAQHAAPIYQSGKYDTAVFEAFKQVEIVIRTQTGLSSLDGDKLMREAFKPADLNKNIIGVLTDVEARDSEQLGISNLFAGAMSSFRNPPGHQNLATNPQEAAELLIFASHLLGIIDKRVSASATPKSHNLKEVSIA